MSNGRGFLGLTAALAVRLQNVTQIPPSLIQFMPNMLAIVALVLVALRSRGLEAWARRRFRAQAQQQLAEQ